MAVPLILLGMGVARMVAGPLAKQLIKAGVGKAAPKGAETAGKAISKMDDLPYMVTAKLKNLDKAPKLKTPKTPKPPNTNTGTKRGSYGRTKAIKAKEAREGLKSRTQKTREQVAAAKPKAPTKTSVPIQKPMSAEARAKMEIQLARQSDAKISGASQIRGAIKKTPSGQKGMRLPGKGETPKRRMGGKIYAQSRNMGGPIRKPRMK
jgi:hypothetical protein